jgi:HK97 family phage major capsid protein
MHYLGTLVSRGGFLLRKVGGHLHGVGAYGLMPQNHGAISLRQDSRGSSFFSSPLFMILAIVAVMLVALLFGAAPMHLGFAGMGIAGTVKTASKTDTPSKKPAKIREMESNLKALAKELEAGQVEMAAGPISSERGEELEEKAKEMGDLQDHLDRYNKIAGIVKSSREVERATLPGEGDIGRKSLRTTAGHLFVMSDSYKRYKDNGKEGWSSKVNVGRRFGKAVTLHGEEAVEFERKAYDPATLSDLGTDTVIQIDRDGDLVRFEEPEILTFRDVLNVTTTNSDAIKYVKHTATQRAAATVARGGLKPFLKVTFAPDQVSVETIAVLSKVTEQDVDDAPRLVGYINGEMTLDVKVEEERQLVWGTGTNELRGVMDPANNVPEFTRAEAGDTVIDVIRRMRTDLRKKRVTPNFVMIDPIDWEEIELAKGTDARYIWGLITDLRGPRIWSLRVIESDAMTNLETEERRILVGDGVRGATLYDRSSIQLAVGFMDDDFGRNLRTLRAEERLALAVKRPYAFEFAITAAPQS